MSDLTSSDALPLIGDKQGRATTDNPVYRRRRWVNRFNLAMSLATMAFGMIFLLWILAILFSKGMAALGLALFTQMTPPPGADGGLANAIVGSLIIVAAAIFIATPIGILAGIYLAEIGRNSTTAKVTRFINDILLSAPSIVIGLFVYTLIVLNTGAFSAWAGALALAVIVIPIVVRTTEDMLRLIPDTLREAAIGLGAPKWKMITFVCYRAAREGILTGILLAVARVAGETAPLIFTSLGNLNWSLNLNAPMASLPVTIYQYAGSAFQEWIDLAWVGALLITVGVLGLNVAARYAVRGVAR